MTRSKEQLDEYAPELAQKITEQAVDLALWLGVRYPVPTGTVVEPLREYIPEDVMLAARQCVALLEASTTLQTLWSRVELHALRQVVAAKYRIRS